MALSWEEQLVVFECRYPRISLGDRLARRGGYWSGFQPPDSRPAAVSTKPMVWVEMYDPLPWGQSDWN